MKSAAQNMDVASCAHQALLASLVVVGGGALMAVAREGRDPLDESSIGSVTTSVVACLGMIPNEALISSKLTDLDSSDISQTIGAALKCESQTAFKNTSDGMNMQ